MSRLDCKCGIILFNHYELYGYNEFKWRWIMGEQMNRIKWAGKEFEWLGRRCVHAITGKYYVNYEKYAGQGIAGCEETNRFVYNGLMGEAPFALGKTGFGEIGVMCCAQNELFYNSRVHYYWTPSYIGGIDKYKKDNGIRRYHRINLNAMNSLDAIGTYAEMFMCDAVLETVPNIKNILIFGLDALYSLDEVSLKWTQALKGKRVLIVSPFYKEIELQYEKRNLLWKDGRLPDFSIEFDPSIWVAERGFFESLDIVANRVIVRNFDIALLACGSIGIPLASEIKKAGKKAVHMGSAMNLLFGLKGKRWDGKGIYNEYWIRPGDDTKPTYADGLDGETYW